MNPLHMNTPRLFQNNRRTCSPRDDCASVIHNTKKIPDAVLKVMYIALQNTPASKSPEGNGKKNNQRISRALSRQRSTDVPG